MNWKLIFLGLAVLALLAYVVREGFTLKNVQGFQNASEYTFTMYYADWVWTLQEGEARDGGTCEEGGHREEREEVPDSHD